MILGKQIIVPTSTNQRAVHHLVAVLLPSSSIPGFPVRMLLSIPGCWTGSVLLHFRQRKKMNPTEFSNYYQLAKIQMIILLGK